MWHIVCLDCNHKNVEDDFYCTNCGSNLAGIPPTSDEKPEETISSVLSLHHAEKGEFVFPLRDGAVLGRENDINMTDLDPHCYISGRHARFTCKDGQWWLEILSVTNPSKHNDRPLRMGRKQPLSPGDRLEFAGQVFILKD